MANEDLNKGVQQELEKTARELEKARSKLKPAFKNLVDNIKDVNPELAKNIATLREQSKDSFAGALQATKFSKQSKLMSDIQEKGLDSMKKLDPKGIQELTATFEAYGDSSFSLEEWANLEADKANRLKQLRRQGTALETAENELADSKKALADKEKQQAKSLAGMTDEQKAQSLEYYSDENKALKDEVKAKQAVADRKKKLHEDESKRYNSHLEQSKDLQERQNEVFKAVSEDSGRFGEISDALNTLTGIDIGGMADSVVKNINAVGKLFGKDDLFGSMMEGFQGIDLSGIKDSLGGMMGSVSAGMGKMSKGIMKRMAIMSTAVGGFFTAMATSVMTGLAAAGTAIMTGLGAIGGALMTAGGMLMTGATIVWTSIATFFSGLLGVMSRLLASGLRMLAAIPMLIVNAAMFVAGLISTAASLLIAALPFIAIGLLIIGAVLGLVLAFKWMYDNLDWFKLGVDWIAEKFWEAYVFLRDWGVFESIKTYIGDLFDSITGIFTGIIDFVKAALDGDTAGMWDAISKIFESIKDLFLAPFKFVKNLLTGGPDEHEEGMDEAKDSGLYKKWGYGFDSGIEESMVKGAPMGQLKAIVADADLSEEDMKMITDEIARQEAINLTSAGEPTTGQEVATGTQELAGAGAGGAVTVINQVNDNSQNSSSTNVHGGSGKTTNSDSTAGRVANNVE